MIDRKATCRIFAILFLAMTAGSVWRLSLFPDWRLPGGHNTISGLYLFALPASLLIMMAI